MAKFCADSVLDAALDKIATATTLHVCPSQPADRAAAISSSLGSISLSSGDFTKANGATSGRQTTVAEKTVSITANGTANHVALIDGSELLYVTTTAVARAVTNGDTLTVEDWIVELRDPT